MTPYRQVRAAYDDTTIRFYQAYRDEIAGTFVAPFKRDRMTWIKPSFRWMLYRSGWARKDPGQERVLAIDITRGGFEWALRSACLNDDATRLGRDEARRLLDASPVARNDPNAAAVLLPAERPYPLPADADRLEATPEPQP
jgi:hypothetical protein